MSAVETEETCITRQRGRRSAVLALLLVPLALAPFVYVETSSDRFALDNIRPAVTWAVGIVLSLGGLLTAVIALILSRFRRLSPWMVITLQLLILLYAVIRPLAAVIVAIDQMEGRGWH